VITRERLKQLLRYDLGTGWFINLTQRNYNASIGARAGKIVCGGRYRRIKLDGIEYYEHHLAWLYVYGYMPDQIDHWYDSGLNNCIFNLREATQSENMCNAHRTPGESGLRGAYLDKRRSTWHSKVQLGGQVWNMGPFDNAEEAHEAYLRKAKEVQGEFALHNSNPSEVT